MELREFLLERVTEAERKLEMMPLEGHLDAYRAIQKVLANQRYILEWHKNWPVLIETEPKFEHRAQEYSTDWVMSLTKQMMYLTEQEYVKRFGTAPPTTPLLRAMALSYTDHEDFQEEWLK